MCGPIDRQVRSYVTCLFLTTSVTEDVGYKERTGRCGRRAQFIWHSSRLLNMHKESVDMTRQKHNSWERKTMIEISYWTSGFSQYSRNVCNRKAEQCPVPRMQFHKVNCQWCPILHKWTSQSQSSQGLRRRGWYDRRTLSKVKVRSICLLAMFWQTVTSRRWSWQERTWGDLLLFSSSLKGLAASTLEHQVRRNAIWRHLEYNSF